MWKILDFISTDFLFIFPTEKDTLSFHRYVSVLQFQIIVSISGVTTRNVIIGRKSENATETLHGWHDVVIKLATIATMIVETNISRRNVCSGQIWVNVMPIRNGCTPIARSHVVFASVVSW